MSIDEKQLQHTQVLHQQRKLDEALLNYQKLNQQDPNNLLVIQLTCLLFIQIEKPEEAQLLIEKSLKLQPKEASLYNSLGNVLKRQGKIRDAIHAYETALSITPDYPGALNNLGNAYLETHETSKAKKCYQKGILIDEAYPDAHFNLARVLQMEGEIETAIQHLTIVNSIAPNHAAAKGFLANLYIERKEYSKGIGLLKERLEIQPNHAHSLQTLASAYLIEGERESALKYYLQHITHEINTLSLYNIGVIFSDRQQHNEAIHYFKEVLELDPIHLPTILNLAAIYLKKNEIKDAIHYYEQALKIDPDNQETQHILHALRQDKRPDSAPKEYISHLFDQYALSYDKHLTEILKYQVPKAIHDAIITEINPKAHSLKILDLGCGTGLSGKVFEEQTREIIGVDASSEMLNVAREKNIYNTLIHKPIEEALDHLQGFDLAIAADVFPYLGDLKAIFSKVHQALNKNGVFVFSIEMTNEENYVLQKNIRYAHNKNYIKRLSIAYKFDILHFINVVLRNQQNKPIEGYVFLLKKKERIV